MSGDRDREPGSKATDGGGSGGAGAEQPQKPRRFFHHAATRADGGGFVLTLDERPARTPGRRALSVPTEALGAAIAAEWAAQATHIDAATMPLTRIANTVIDGVTDNAAAVREEIVKYAGSDLLCYRAASPASLVERQDAAWNPLLEWASHDLGATLETTAGVMPIAQSADAAAAIAAQVAKLDPFQLGPAHIMTTVSGSAILALAVLTGRLSAQDAWACAHIDEDWQISQWGQDEEAAARRVRRWQEMERAATFAELSKA